MPQTGREGAFISCNAMATLFSGTCIEMNFSSSAALGAQYV